MDSARRLERRSKLRISGPYPAVVRGVDARGGKFEEETFVENLSANGAYMTLGREVSKGSRLFLVVQLANGPGDLPPPRVAITGAAARIDPRPDGGCGLALIISNHRFLGQL